MLMALRKILLGISPHEASFAKLGYEACEVDVRRRLEEVIRVFIAGYNLALRIDDSPRLADHLERSFDRHHVGFAFEGAGMYYALRDLLAPWSAGRLRSFTDEVAPQHDHIVTVGAGLAVARVPWGPWALTGYLRRLDPALGWCVPDGLGFHQGLFHHRRFIDRCEAPPRALPGIAHQLFDSGLGRAIWWVKGASPRGIRAAIDAFQSSRRPELWCGIGVACAYACGVGHRTLRQLGEVSGRYRADLLSGIPFAAHLRQKGNNPSRETENVCQLLLGMTAEAADLWIVEKVAEVERGPGWSGASRRAEGYLDAYPLVRESLKADLPAARHLQRPGLSPPSQVFGRAGPTVPQL